MFLSLQVFVQFRERITQKEVESIYSLTTQLTLVRKIKN